MTTTRDQTETPDCDRGAPSHPYYSSLNARLYRQATSRSVQPTGQPPFLPWLLVPRDYRHHCARLACAVNPSALLRGTGLRPLTALREPQIRRVRPGARIGYASVEVMVTAPLGG